MSDEAAEKIASAIGWMAYAIFMSGLLQCTGSAVGG